VARHFRREGDLTEEQRLAQFARAGCSLAVIDRSVCLHHRRDLLARRLNFERVFGGPKVSRARRHYRETRA
jgi:hypothetical protein